MKRSEINQQIARAIDFFETMRFKLPAWGYWSPAQWKGKGPEAAEIMHCRLGWDITDFGNGDFAKKGLILFTLRNGNLVRDKKTYAEKIMVVAEDQETPMHFHWKKMEDIINRGGGNLIIELHGSTPDEALSDTPLVVSIDGMQRTVDSGTKISLSPGESICLEQGMYHRFYGEAGKGSVLAGEVSMVNDDSNDNRFLKPQGRFPDIEENEPPRYLLAIDYPRFL
jgi:D-lyxose ketol-isomerase